MAGPSTKRTLVKLSKNKLLRPKQFPPKSKVASGAVLTNFYKYPLSKLSSSDLQTVQTELTKDVTDNPHGGGKTFKLFRTNETYIGVPRYYGIVQWGWPEQCEFADAAPMNEGISFKGELRPVQKEAVTAVMQQLQSTGGALLLKDCGLGKTVDACYMAVQLGLRTAVLVYDEDLMKQWKDSINRWFPDAKVGIVQRDKQQYEGMDFVIMMVQSLFLRMGAKGRQAGKSYDQAMFDSIGILVADEAHHVGSLTSCFAINLFRARYTLAMTATPQRGDKHVHLLSWLMGAVAFERERELGDMQVHVYVHRHDCSGHKEIMYRRKGQKPILAKAKMYENLFKDPVRNQSIIDRLVERAKENRQILVLSTYHYGIEVISKLFQERMPDVSVGFFTGRTKRQDRLEELHKQVVFATAMKGDEGIDREDFDTLFRIDPVAKSKQQVGRILRELPGKKPIVEHWHDAFSDFDGWFHNCLRYYNKKGYFVHNLSTNPNPIADYSDSNFTFL